MMNMTIHWSKYMTLLFDSWKTNSWTSYSLTLLACFLFSTFYQYMEDRRLRFKSLSSSTPSTPSTAPLLSKLRIGRVSPGRIWSAALFGVNSAIGYLLMLAIMSFNGGVFVAVVLGLAFGYFLFRTGDEEVVVVENTCACS